MSGVHQFVRIGAHAMLGGASALVQDVPPFVIAASDKNGNKATPHGVNVEGLRRRGFDAGQIAALRQAYKLLYKSDLGFDEARSEISALLGQTDAATGAPLRAFVEFLAATQRGIVR
jgi:UDP-N-acetylglucosamine acyltransferase